MCMECDAAIHKRGKRRSHIRTFICNSCCHTGVYRCHDCAIYICKSCYEDHSSHAVEILKSQSRTALLWDLAEFPMVGNLEFQNKLAGIREVLGDLEVIKCYSKTPRDETGVEICQIEDLSEIESITLDLSVQAARGITTIAIIYAKAIRLKPHATRLSDQFPGLQILASTTLQTFHFTPVRELVEEVYNIRTVYNYRQTYTGTLPGTQIPVHQPFMRNPEKGGIYDRLLLSMIEKAHRGEIMINF